MNSDAKQTEKKKLTKRTRNDEFGEQKAVETKEKIKHTKRSEKMPNCNFVAGAFKSGLASSTKNENWKRQKHQNHFDL